MKVVNAKIFLIQKKKKKSFQTTLYYKGDQICAGNS